MVLCRAVIGPLSVASLVSLGCADDADRNTGRTVWNDTVGGVEYVHNLAQRRSTLRPIVLEEDLKIGEALGDTAYEFMQIWDVEVDHLGAIYVLDAQRHQVLRYDSTGHFIQAFGRQGSGPGEFRWPARLVWMADSLAVWDRAAARLTLFSRDGHYVRDTTVIAWMNVEDIAWMPNVGFLIQVGPVWSSPPDPAGDGLTTVMRVDTRTGTGRHDTVISWSDTAAMVAYQGRGVAAVAEVPFGIRGSWTATYSGTVFQTSGREYTVAEYSVTGERRRVITMESRRYPLSPRERDSVQRKMRTLRRELRGLLTIPSRKPAVGRVIATEGGALWVRVYSKDDSEVQTWDVFDASGVHVFRVTLPAALRVMLVTDYHVYGVERDSLGVQRLGRYRLASPRSVN